MSRQRAQRGIALITAIILVAIATVLAVAIGYGTSLTMRRAYGVFTVAQGLQFGAGAEAMAAYILKQDVTANPSDSLDQDWAKPYGPMELDAGVTLEAALDDEQGKFNLNNLVNAEGVSDPLERARFERLLALLGLEIKWATLVTDWIDADHETTYPDGAEDGTYTGFSPPYRTANLQISSISELLALPGFGRARFARLAPFVTALPSGTPINVCTASGELLDALTPGRVEWSVDPQALANRRTKGCFPTLTDLHATLGDGVFASQKLTQRLLQRSGYFRLRTWITIGTTQFTLYSLLRREAGGQVRPILRTFGTD